MRPSAGAAFGGRGGALTVLTTLLTILQMPEGARRILFRLIVLFVTAPDGCFDTKSTYVYRDVERPLCAPFATFRLRSAVPESCPPLRSVAQYNGSKCIWVRACPAPNAFTMKSTVCYLAATLLKAVRRSEGDR